ncbi:uncharacterized protein LOC135344162 [Halichondria panicea]|uniref:uncharacterized protein LOC135344162 n=1 Tax=Halichondria panicea TaxID=6063 RepID=UPI00312B3435
MSSQSDDGMPPPPPPKWARKRTDLEYQAEENLRFAQKFNRFNDSLRSSKINDDGFLALNLPYGGEIKIYVRESYKILHDLIHHQYAGKHIIISGNPGIGKSWFSLFELIMSLKNLSTSPYTAIVYENPNLGIKCVFNEDGYQSSDESVALALYSFCTLFLYDCSTNGKEPTLLSNAITIVYTSPRESNYKNFQKQKKPLKCLYMPTWTVDELKKIAPVDMDVSDRFRVWGGIPRYILDEDLDQAVLHRAVNAIKEVKIYELAFKSGGDETIGHKIYHMDVSSDYTSYDTSFASEFILEYVMQKIEMSCYVHAVDFINTYASGDACVGQLFEAISHGRLKKGGKFLTRKLGSEEEMPLTLKEPEFVLFEDLQNFQTKTNKPKYLLPKSKTFPSVDSIWVDGEDMVLHFK